MRSWLLAETYLNWVPAWSSTGLAAIAACCLILWCLLRIFGGASKVNGRFGLLFLRCCSLGILVVILLGPTMVDEQSSEVTRPSLLYVVDGSQSMQLGRETSRWQESLEFVQLAERSAGAEHAKFSQAFRFGHQLQPLLIGNNSKSAGGSSVSLISSADASENAGTISGPDASDSRLADAFRQLLPQVNSSSTAGVVLLSDGRVRASDTVEQLAELFGQSQVPIHVVPIGKATGTGDIAVVSLVVPSRVRKFTENELQVFLRSFGYTGQRTTVRVMSRNKLSNTESATLAEVPITLSGGAQSVSLTFRMDDTPQDLAIVVDPLEGELTDRNNRVETRVEINRTKVRVLYIEGVSTQFFSPFNNIRSSAEIVRNRGRIEEIDVRNALQADEDVECRVLRSINGGTPQVVASENELSSPRGLRFPAARAELFAYDCVIFSNVGPEVLEEEQVQWLAQWVEGRGGGLIVAGSDALNKEAWRDSPLEPLLPLTLDSNRPGPAGPVNVTVSAPRHPIWRLRLEERLNEELLDQLPPLQLSESEHVPKSTAEVLAIRRESGEPMMIAHRAGRGRVIATSADLGSQALIELSNTWGSQPERVATKLWRNLVYWATEGSATGRRRLIAESDKRFYRPGEGFAVTATAYDESARRTQNYRIWAMFEPTSLDELSMYSPVLWPDNVVRESGEVSPRIVWGEELPLTPVSDSERYEMRLQLSETSDIGDSGFRIEMTAYLADESSSAFNHGTQVDSTSLAVQIISDPFEQQNPLPNHELLHRVAAVSGGEILESPAQLAEIMKNRREIKGTPHRDLSPAWSRWWLWLCLLGLLSTEWICRRVTGLA